MAAAPMVTGDAVVLDVRIAQLPIRAASALIDVTVTLVLYAGGVTLWALADRQFDDALAAATAIVFTVLALVVYPVAFEVSTRGRSLGKMAMGLRVVSDDGGPERFRQAVFRAMAAVVEIWMLTGGPAVISSLASARGKRLGDVFAGTMVIVERAPTMAAPPGMPPSLAWWAASLQLSGVPPQQWDRARQFLSRAHQLEPSTRDRMASRIGDELAAQLSPPPPPDAPPALVLAAALAERHRRERERLAPRAMPVVTEAARPTAPPPAGGLATPD